MCHNLGSYIPFVTYHKVHGPAPGSLGLVAGNRELAGVIHKIFRDPGTDQTQWTQAVAPEWDPIGLFQREDSGGSKIWGVAIFRLIQEYLTIAVLSW